MFLLDSRGLRCEQSLSFLFGVFLSCNKESLENISAPTARRIALSAFVLAVIALAIKQLPLLRELEGSIVWDFTQVCIKFPFAVAILFGMMFFRGLLLRSQVLPLLGVASLEVYLVHMHYRGMVSSPLDVITFVILSLGMSYSFYKFNSLYKNVTFPSLKLRRAKPAA